jgi:hypothetical protein
MQMTETEARDIRRRYARGEPVMGDALLASYKTFERWIVADTDLTYSEWFTTPTALPDAPWSVERDQFPRNAAGFDAWKRWKNGATKPLFEVPHGDEAR